MNVVEARNLSKRYGSTQALRDCTLAIPDGHVTALVGPNGAGKSTLLNLVVGLLAPSAGSLTVLGSRRPGSLDALDGIAFVAQDTPLYKNVSAADMLHLTRNLNRHFDWAYAEARLGELGIPLKRKAGKLSGGQQAQLALTLALARHPKLDGWILQLVPALIGAFVGAPVLAREMETGTYRSHTSARTTRLGASRSWRRSLPTCSICAESHSVLGPWPPSRSAPLPACSCGRSCPRSLPLWSRTPDLPSQPGCGCERTT